jgi:hypothetical protein
MRLKSRPLLKRQEIRRSAEKTEKTAPIASSIQIKKQDAFEFLTGLEPGSVDLLVSSPPYCMGKAYETSINTADFISMHERLAPLLVRALKDGGSLCWQIGHHVHDGVVIADILKLASNAGVPIQTYPYVGLGGSVFYDFQILFRYLGIRRMTSLEHSPHLLERCEFNKPYRFIDIFPGTTSQYINSKGFSEPTLVWFDYDWRLSSMITSDIEALGSTLPIGSVIFITLCVEPPKSFQEKKLDAEGKVAWLEEELQSAAANPQITDVSNSKFRFYVERVIKNAIKYSFAVRRPGKLVQLISAFYRDTAWMYTFGVAFVEDDQAAIIQKMIKSHLPFLHSESYDIPDFNISERERRLFDQACTGKRQRRTMPSSLSKLGFSETDVEAYSHLMRYLPHYTETLI